MENTDLRRKKRWKCILNLVTCADPASIQAWFNSTAIHEQSRLQLNLEKALPFIPYPDIERLIQMKFLLKNDHCEETGKILTVKNKR